MAVNRWLVLVIVLCFVSLAVTAFQRTDPEREIAQILDLLPVTERTTVADVGAGSGFWTQLIAPHADRVFATEARSSTIRIAALYDIHANLPALEAVADELQRSAPARAFGRQP